MNPVKLCEGFGMPCCYSCARNVDNHPGDEREATLTPAADPPSWCMDWHPMPVVRVERSA